MANPSLQLKYMNGLSMMRLSEMDGGLHQPSQGSSFVVGMEPLFNYDNGHIIGTKPGTRSSAKP